MTYEEFLARVGIAGGKKTSNGWDLRCPAHDDKKASLSVARARDGGVMLDCKAGCQTKDVVGAYGLAVRDLFAQPQLNGTAKRDDILAVYSYSDEHGEVLHETVRSVGKKFLQRRPDPVRSGEYIWKLGKGRLVLYRLPEVLKTAAAGGTVIIAEGEKDVDALRALGFTATTNPMGAGKWRDEFSDALRGANLVVIPDNDEPGRGHAESVARSAHGKASSVRVLELPNVPEAGDVSDWLAAGGTAEQLKALARSTPLWIPDGRGESSTPGPRLVAQADPSDGDDEADDFDIPMRPRPMLGSKALHGPAGFLVQAIEPYTEAHVAPMLAHLLVGVGSVVGRQTYLHVGGATHCPNLYALIIGDTADGRKGTSWSEVRPVLQGLEPDWFQRCVVDGGGLSTGEGLIHRVRDPVTALNKRGETVLEDEGVTDKRLMIVETEFGRVLRVMIREGQTTNAILRQGWDGCTLQTLTKGSKEIATGAHISVVGHVTEQELRAELAETDQWNGFGNRFLNVSARRSKLLPEPMLPPDDVVSGPRQLLRLGLAFGREGHEMRRSEGFRACWKNIYPELAAGRPGVLGALTSRAPAQVLRIAMVYAILDRVETMEPAHLEAAHALWGYCEDSTRYVFGDSLGQHDADRLLEALRSAPLGRLTFTDIANGVFQKNTTTVRLQSAVAPLLGYRLAHVIEETTRGRKRRTLVLGAGQDHREAA